MSALLPDIKAWSNFRLMVVIGSVFTVLSLMLGGFVVQAALDDGGESDGSLTRSEIAESAAGASPPAPLEESEAGSAAAPAGSPALNLDSGSTFRITCLSGNPTDTQNTCQVESFNGFTGRVNLSCSDLPPGLSCAFRPSSVTPRANGATPFRLELSAGAVPPGSYVFDVVGRSGNLVSRFRYPWGLAALRVAVSPPPLPPPPPPGAPPAAPPPAPAPGAAEPTFSFTCGSLTEGNKVRWSLERDGTAAKIDCFLTPLNGFDEPVTFEFVQRGDVAKPDTVRFSLDRLQSRKQFDLNFEFSNTVRGLPAEQLRAGRDYVFEVKGTSESGKSLTRQVTLTVTE